MAIPISPGVYTKIIDLSTYLQAVPGTIGFVPILSKRGRDNDLRFIASQEELFSEYGKPNVMDYGKNYGQGLYVASNHLSVSTSLFVLRVLPEDAEYANLFMYADPTADASAGVTVESLDSQNSVEEISTQLSTVLPNKVPIAAFYPVGRGDDYNRLGIRIAQHSNPQVEGIFLLDVYETQADGDEQIVESFEVSFDDTLLDDAGESIFIEDVMNRYSKLLRIKVNFQGIKVVDDNNFEITTPFLSANPVKLDNGSEGSLIEVNAETGKSTVSTIVADQILSQGYSGVINDDVIDLDSVYFSLVWDPGYSSNVKQAIFTLVNDIRRDCVAIMDNGDNPDYTTAMESRDMNHTFNSRYCALYESYSEVYDMFTGRDIWVSPVYHMATMIPLNDRLYDIWYPSAGFDRGTISNIKQLRFNPKLGQRDQMYLAQLNPIVKFNVGYTMWGQLTSQKKPSKLQDLHAMRTVLYIKRALEQYCKFYVFEHNTSETWDRISRDIGPFLEYIRSKKGLTSFSVDVGASEYELKAKICHVDVTLVPTPIIEKIQLNLFIK